MAEFARLLDLHGDDRDLREEALRELFGDVHLAASALGFQSAHIVDETKRPHLSGKASCNISLLLGNHGFTATLRYVPSEKSLRIAQELDDGMVQSTPPVTRLAHVQYVPDVMRFQGAHGGSAAATVARAITDWFTAAKRH